MKDIIGDMMSIIGLIFTIGIMTALFLVATDTNVQTHLRDTTTAYADTVRANGKLSPGETAALMDKINGTGQFEVTLKVTRALSYYRSDGIATDAMTITQAEILEYMYPDEGPERPFILNSGDRITVKVTRTTAGLTGLMSLIGRSGQPGDLICEYGGTVYHDGA